MILIDWHNLSSDADAIHSHCICLRHNIRHYGRYIYINIYVSLLTVAASGHS